MGENSFKRVLHKLEERKNKQVVVVNNGVNTLGLLGVGLILLKATGYINWSWIWVVAPFWIPLCIALLVFILVSIAIAIMAKNGNFTMEETEDTPPEEGKDVQPTTVPIVISVIHELGEPKSNGTPDSGENPPSTKPKPKKET